MNTYGKYIKARNLAWKILTDFKLYSFPIDIKLLCDNLDISVLKIDKLDNDNYSMSAKLNEKTYIIYIPHSEQVDRFTIAHELGHILLDHINIFLSKNLEEQANIFASRLLCPLCIIKHFEFKKVKQVMDYFGISEEFATIRLNRFKIVNDRKKFLYSKLENNYYYDFCKYNKLPTIIN